MAANTIQLPGEPLAESQQALTVETYDNDVRCVVEYEHYAENGMREPAVGRYTITLKAPAVERAAFGECVAMRDGTVDMFGPSANGGMPIAAGSLAGQAMIQSLRAYREKLASRPA